MFILPRINSRQIGQIYFTCWYGCVSITGMRSGHEGVQVAQFRRIMSDSIRRADQPRGRAQLYELPVRARGHGVRDRNQHCAGAVVQCREHGVIGEPAGG